jgi:dUTP pyrophosphatase
MRVKLLTQTARAPERMSAGAAAYDIYADEDKVIEPQSRSLVSTGISIEIPITVYAQIAPRSGLAVKEFLCDFRFAAAIFTSRALLKI